MRFVLLCQSCGRPSIADAPPSVDFDNYVGELWLAVDADCFASCFAVGGKGPKFEESTKVRTPAPPFDR